MEIELSCKIVYSATCLVPELHVLDTDRISASMSPPMWPLCVWESRLRAQLSVHALRSIFKEAKKFCLVCESWVCCVVSFCAVLVRQRYH